MTLEEEGAYIHLLAHCWDSPDCSLPDDDAELAQLSRMCERWVNGGSVKLRACFIPHPKKVGRLFNARLLEERKKQVAWRKKSQEGGKRSAESRALKANPRGSVVEGCLNGGAMEVEPKANSSSSVFSLQSSLKDKTKNTSTRSQLNGHQAGFDLFWTAYPKKRGKGKAEKVWAALTPDDVLLGTMLGKLDIAKQTPDWTKDSGQFIPHPASWLNAKGWEDEYAPVPKARLVL